MKTVTLEIDSENARELSSQLREQGIKHRIIDSPAEVRGGEDFRTSLKGMGVSVDVSTCDEDIGNRYFGTVTEVMEHVGGKHGLMLLVQDAEPNFTQPAPSDSAQAVRVPAELFQRVVALLEKAQIFDLTKELKSAQKPAMQTLQTSWRSWNGGECPVDPDTVVFYKIRKRGLGEIPHGPCRAGNVNWSHGRHGRDVIAYTIDFSQPKHAPSPQAPAPASDAVAQPVESKLWLWRNGDHFLAFSHEHPCYEPGGDPMVLGDPAATAIYLKSHDRAYSTTETEKKVIGDTERIVLELRKQATYYTIHSSKDVDAILDNAADEIERLDARCDREAEMRHRYESENTTLRQQLAAAQQQSAAASLYVEVGYQYLVRDGFGHQFWHDKDFYNGSRATASRKIFALASTDAAQEGQS